MDITALDLLWLLGGIVLGIIFERKYASHYAINLAELKLQEEVASIQHEADVTLQKYQRFRLYYLRMIKRLEALSYNLEAPSYAEERQNINLLLEEVPQWDDNEVVEVYLDGE